MLDLCTLGTGGTMPMPDRALAALYARVNGRAILIDCGEGTQVGVQKLGWGMQCIDGILISHFHADHCSGLPGMLLALTKAMRTEPLHIYGPVGLTQVVNGLRADYDKDGAYCGFYMDGVMLPSGIDDTVISDGDKYEIKYEKA